MMARIDKYFIAELQERGYDFDFKKLCDIYRASRERPDYINCLLYTSDAADE